MSRRKVDDDEEEEGESDDGFDEDMEALRRACMITGVNAVDVNDGGGGENLSDTAEASGGGGEPAWDSDSEDDLELLRSIKNRFALSADVFEPLSLRPLSVLPPIGLSDDDDDDFETLRAVRRRFASFNDTDAPENCTKDLSGKQELVHAPGIASDNKTSNHILNRANTCETFPDSQQLCVTVHGSDEASNAGHLIEANKNMAIQPFDQPDSCGSSLAPLSHSSFPESAQAFVDAIKRNRSYQRFLRSKLSQVEAKIVENKKLKGHVKILKDLQVHCKKTTGRALSQKKDPRAQLISARKSGTCDSSGGNDKKVSPMHCGPSENPHVANYRMALEKYPLSVVHKNWSKEEKENLAKGIRQQVQESLLYEALDRFSCSDGSSVNNPDNIVESIRDLEITPEMIRQFLPKVNWDQLASMYVKDHSGSECEAQWLNYEDPLINHDEWTAEEDMNLLLVIQEKGITNWVDIAVSLGTNRTPFKCLTRYQRSLNPCILNREWTQEEDDQLRDAVCLVGEEDWQSVASKLVGRTGKQCSERWRKTLHPTRKRAGRWTLDEDKRLKVAVTLFGAKNWPKIAQFVPGRTQSQCRGRWSDCLDPNLNFDKFTEEEDAKLRTAVAEHGYKWSYVARLLPTRTDNMCWRRWKELFPHQVPLLREARRKLREARMGNFADRESERPALGISDFMPPLLITWAPEPENINSTRKRKRGMSNVQKKNGSKRVRRAPKRSSLQSSKITNDPEVETFDENNVILQKKVAKQSSKRKNCSEDSPKEKRKCRSRSGNNKCTIDDAESQDVPILPLESVESWTSNGIETFGGDYTKIRKKNHTTRQSRRKLAESGKEQNSMPSEDSGLSETIDETPVFNYRSSSQDSTLLAKTDSEEGGNPDLQKKKEAFTKPRLKKASPKPQTKKASLKSRLKTSDNIINEREQPRNENEGLEEHRDINALVSKSEERETNSWDMTLADFISTNRIKTG